jgi:hypothetical protein
VKIEKGEQVGLTSLIELAQVESEGTRQYQEHQYEHKG